MQERLGIDNTLPATRKTGVNGTRLDIADGQAPIWGDSPNNAGAANLNEVNTTQLGSLLQSPHFQQQRPLLLPRASITDYLRSIGRSFKGTSEELDSALPKPGISQRGATGTSKGTRDTRATQISSQPFHITLDVDNYSYSRDVVDYCINRGSPKLDRQRSCSRSPDEYRRSTKRSLNRVPEEMEVPPSHERVDFPSVENNHPNQTNVDGPRFYGSVGYSASPVNLSASQRYPEGVFDEDESDLSEEEEEWLLDEELAKRGLYRGNYKFLLLIYTLVPVSTILSFVFLALLPSFAFPTSKHSEFPYSPYLPFPFPEIIVATALWALSYLLRDFLHATSVSGTTIVSFATYRFPALVPVLTSLLSAFLQGVSSLFFQLLAVPILLIPYYSTEHVGKDGLHQIQDQSFFNVHKRHFPTWHDDAFRRVWWVALGWAAAEAVVGIKQGFESISLYKDVLVTARRKEVNYMETRRSRDEEDHSAPATRENSGELRSVTPTQTRLSVTDTSLTPTQDAPKRKPLSINPSPPPPRRELSDSISSINSAQMPSGQGYPSSGIGVGEREPLLKIDVRPEMLSRRATDELSGLSIESEVERDLDELLALKNREELEEVYGMPVIRIPVAISCLHRINSILSSLGIYLLITSAYIRSTFAYLPSGQHTPITTSWGIHQDPPSNKSLAFTLPPILLLQVFLSMMHTPWILPRIGIHTFVYVGLLASLGLFFGGLGMWEVLT